jgi:hypothetical protein
MKEVRHYCSVVCGERCQGECPFSRYGGDGDDLAVLDLVHEQVSDASSRAANQPVGEAKARGDNFFERNHYCTGPPAKLLGRMSKKQAAIAIANKTTRIAWAIMVHGGVYEAGHRAARYRAEACAAAG